MDAFLEAHRAFHGRDRHTQYEHSAASVITRHREAAIAALRTSLNLSELARVAESGRYENACANLAATKPLLDQKDDEIDRLRAEVESLRRDREDAQKFEAFVQKFGDYRKAYAARGATAQEDGK